MMRLVGIVKSLTFISLITSDMDMDIFTEVGVQYPSVISAFRRLK
jgi:hypothetical protein